MYKFTYEIHESDPDKEKALKWYSSLTEEEKKEILKKNEEDRKAVSNQLKANAR